MEIFMQKNGILYVVAALCILSVLSKAILHRTYKRLLTAAKDMGKTEHRLMKTLRVRFDTCYQLKIGVPNVSVFVDKNLGHYKVFGTPLYKLDNFSGMCMILAMLGGISGGICAMYMGMDGNIVYPALCSGVIGNGIILIFDHIFANSDLRELLRVDVMDYLENIYKPRLENETFHSQMLKEYRQEYFADDPVSEKIVRLPGREKMEDSDANSDKKEAYPLEFTEKEEAVIREVIREYMG